jgi:cobalamin biosynthesis Mg chelatase CobN
MENKETLEEAIDRIFLYQPGDMSKGIAKKKAIELAKWQAEQYKNKYSEEDLEVAYFEGKEGLYSFNDWLRQFKKK